MPPDEARSKPAGRPDRIRSAVYDFLSRRNQGESLTPEAYAATHPDLSPELSKALETGIRRLQQAREVERSHGAAPAMNAPQGSSPADSIPARARRLIRGYQLCREISSGSQGTVFEAIQESTGRTVAVKVIPGVSKNSIARYEREVQALASVNHRGLVGVIDRGRTSDDAYYLAMEFIRGCDLDAWVNGLHGKPNAQRDVVALFAKVAAAIESVHARGIVHRDLKPSNIRVDPSGDPCIVDFGLAHFADETRQSAGRALTVTGNIVGSIPWASPEQASGAAKSFGPASDVYSLGVLLFHALTGRFPYAVDGPLHVTTRNICDVPPANPSRLANLPFGPVNGALSSIVLKCLAKAPADRFASGGDLAASLAAYRDGTYVAPRRRRRRLPIFAAATSIVLAGATTWAVLPYISSRPEPLAIKLPTITNSVGMEFVQIPAGQFKMGSPPSNFGYQGDEQQHAVELTHAYCLSRTEVTRAQYRRVMGTLPATISPGGTDDMPIDQVSWEDANAFCKKLAQMESRDYRLPTEAEWEFACRAGTITPYAGSGIVGEIAWYRDNSNGRIHPVASRAANQWGLFDMQGNAREWVLDNYIPYLGRASVIDPLHLSGEPSKAIRGGNSLDAAEKCRSSARFSAPPDHLAEALGFRVAIGPLPAAR